MKLHLGCGKRYLPGFVHVDLDAFPHIDYRHRVDRLPMFPDEAADLIYCCHALEYLDRLEARDALKEWHRVLAPNGVLRLAVPDFPALAELYAATGKLDAILGSLYGRMVIHTQDGERVIYHRTVYDYGSLEAMLIEAGFRTAARYHWRQTLHRDHDDFSQAYWPHMDKQSGRLLSLNVEAKK